MPGLLAFDAFSCVFLPRSKRSNVRRLIQNYCGKARVRKDTIPLVWCIIVNLLGEVIEHSILPHQNVMKDGEAKNIRIKVCPSFRFARGFVAGAHRLLSVFAHASERGRVQRHPEPPRSASGPSQAVCRHRDESWRTLGNSAPGTRDWFVMVSRVTFAAHSFTRSGWGPGPMHPEPTVV